MTNQEMRDAARRIGILALQKQEIETKIKDLKNQLAPLMKATCPTEESKTGNTQYVLKNVDGFSCKLYERTQLFASQEKAREILHPNTFNAIFSPTTSEVVDVRPTAETKRKGVQLITSMCDNESKVA